MDPKPFRVIPCSMWGARPPKAAVNPAGKPVRAIFHHTAGHHPNLDRDSGESYAEAVAYAKAIQHYHMDSNGWNDTGNNFLVTRNGYVFEGRHGSLTFCQRGLMVVSAHCPGQNDQPGVEIEHFGQEAMTPIQREAAVWLFANLCRWGRFTEIKGHRDYYATECPGPLYAGLPQFRKDVAAALQPPKPPPIPKAKYHIKLVDEKGKEYIWENQHEPGRIMHEFNLVEHKIVQGWIERK